MVLLQVATNREARDPDLVKAMGTKTQPHVPEKREEGISLSEHTMDNHDTSLVRVSLMPYNTGESTLQTRLIKDVKIVL